MSSSDDESLCKTCKHGLVVIAMQEQDSPEVESYQFCNVLETPIKFVAGKKVVECNRYAKQK